MNKRALILDTQLNVCFDAMKKKSIKKITLLTHADRTSIVIGLWYDRHKLTADSISERF